MRVDDDLAAVTEAIDRLVAAGPSAYASGAAIVDLQRQLARFECVVTEATAEFDTWGEWATDGARTAAAWVSARSNLPMKDARRRVARARGLRQLPSCARAFANGDINVAHVDALVGLHRPRTEEALRRDEEMLLEQATTMPYRHFIRALSYWEQLADPDGTERAAQDQRDRRDAYLVPSIGGMFLGKMTLDRVS